MPFDIIYSYWLILILAEQICYLLFMPYPYRYGIKIRTIHIDQSGVDFLIRMNTDSARFSVKVKDTSELFVRYRYPTLTLGPFLFVGRVKSSDASKLEMRAGIFSLGFIIYGIAGELLDKLSPLGLFNLACAFMIIAIFYVRFIKSVGLTMKQTKGGPKVQG